MSDHPSSSSSSSTSDNSETPPKRRRFYLEIQPIETRPKLPTQLTWTNVSSNLLFFTLHSFIQHTFSSIKNDNDIQLMRFSYSYDLLHWLLRPPGFLTSLQVALSEKATGRLDGFVAATPATIRVDTELHRVAIVNFMCIHKFCRNKRLVPFLINELAPRAINEGIWEGLYATEHYVPHPLCRCKWLQRLLNTVKLQEVGYRFRLTDELRSNDAEIQNLPPGPNIVGLRKMKRRDIKEVAELLKKHLKKFKIAPVVDKDFVEYYLLPRQHVVETYVVEDAETHKITDLGSFVIQNMEVGIAKCAED